MEFWRTNIPDIQAYIQQMREQVREIEGRELTPARLKVAIEEDSFKPITVEECMELLKKY
jgi:hypothetical protein